MLFSIAKLLLEAIMGKNLNRFNSKENQIKKIELDLTEINKEIKVSR